MNQIETLTDMLLARATSSRSVHFINGNENEYALTFAELIERAHAFLHALQSRGMVPGDKLVVFSNRNEPFLVAFWGAMLGGIVPVPVAVGISDEHRQKLFRIVRQLGDPMVYTDDDVLPRLKAFAAAQKNDEAARVLEKQIITDDSVSAGKHGDAHRPAPGDLAFIQYSSGSTSDPKGVRLTHGNLCVNVAAIINGLQLSDADSTLSWMPLTHDMGLIGFHIAELTLDIDHTIMETSLFVRRPLLWLQKVAERHATVVCSPNFGYKHFLKVYERKGMEGVDLSHVRLLLNGAEPISVDLCEEFLAATQAHGLRREAMLPVYGLAEASVAVAFPILGREYSYITVDRHSLRIGEQATAVSAGDRNALKAVKVGRAVDGCEIRVCGDNDRVLPDGRVGHIQIRGTNVTSGFVGDPDDTAGLFTGDGWLRTGDCGLIADGDLVITGRAKDIIIVNGQNYYPHDIEEIIAGIDGLELGKVVVCGAQPPDSPVEQLLVFLLHRQDNESFDALADQIRSRVGIHTGLEVDFVIPVARIPKTTSGKVQRSILANAYLDGEYDDVLHAQRTPTPDATFDDEDPLIAELIAICAEFSKDKKVGADDNLFEVGISSLTLTEIMLAVDERYPGRVDINDLFEHPTLRELAEFLRRGEH